MDSGQLYDLRIKMVNGAFIYSTFNQGALHRLCSKFTHPHSYTDGGGNHARHQPAHREQLGFRVSSPGATRFQSLAQGLFDINSGGARV